eukprot:16705-Chlamydomonas_euryale.AAC.4
MHHPPPPHLASCPPLLYVDPAAVLVQRFEMCRSLSIPAWALSTDTYTARHRCWALRRGTCGAWQPVTGPHAGARCKRLVHEAVVRTDMTAASQRM